MGEWKRKCERNTNKNQESYNDEHKRGNKMHRGKRENVDTIIQEGGREQQIKKRNLSWREAEGWLDDTHTQLGSRGRERERLQ